MNKFNTKTISLTPELAQELLTQNKSNRPVRPRRVDELVKIIEQGKWKHTHQGIAIDSNGILQDGQHRLLAVVKSGITITIELSTDCYPDSFDSIDTGSVRSRTDALTLVGIPLVVSRIVAATIPWVYSYGEGRALSNKSPFSISNSESLDFIDKNPVVIKSGEFTASMPSKGKLLQSSITSFLHFEISKRNSNAEEFLKELLVDGCTTNPMILEMRRLLLTHVTGVRKLPESVICKRCIVAYNRWNGSKEFSDPRQILARVGMDSAAEPLMGRWLNGQAQIS